MKLKLTYELCIIRAARIASAIAIGNAILRRGPARRGRFIDVRLNEIASSLSLQDLIMFLIDEFNLSVVRRAQHIR